MRGVRVVVGILFALVLILHGSMEGFAQPRPEKKAPVITQFFAVDRGMYGSTWNIYIEAEATEADMLKVAAVADMVGYGHYPTAWVYLKKEYRRHLKGYRQWNTFSSAAGYLPEWTQITLTVSVFDTAGNESNEVVFPFTFEMGGPTVFGYKLPPPFDQGNLPRIGYISIDLQNPWSDDGRGQRDD